MGDYSLSRRCEVKTTPKVRDRCLILKRMNAIKIKLTSEAKQALHQDLDQSVWWTLYLMELGIEIFPNDLIKMSMLVKDLLEIVKVLCKKLNWIYQDTEDLVEFTKVDHQSHNILQDRSIVKGLLCEWVEVETKIQGFSTSKSKRINGTTSPHLHIREQAV